MSAAESGEVRLINSDDCRLAGHHILVVDKVDDSRTSLANFVTYLQGKVDAQKAAAAQQGLAWAETYIGVFVLHNKRRPKEGHLPTDVLDGR
jgi:hypoxanthine phosphoribosyltransferase